MSIESFDRIHLDLSPEHGKCRFAKDGFGWKPSAGGDTFTLDATQINGAQWSRAAKGHELRIVDRNLNIIQLDGFQPEDYERLGKIFKNWYSTNLEQKEHAIRGWNWGKAELAKGELTFSVQNRPAFEVPYAEISNINLAGRNEVALEFASAADADAATDKTGNEEEKAKAKKNLGGARNKGKKASAGADQLVEVRFYIPGTSTRKEAKALTEGDNKTKKEEDDGKEEGEADEDEEEQEEEEENAATLFYESLLLKADLGATTGDTIATFQDVLHLTPRGRYDLDMYETACRLRGKTYDYKIQYEAVKKFMVLPKPDEMHYMLVIGLDPPLRQGQTRYPFLVMQVKRDEEVEIDLNISEEDLKTKYDQLQASYEQPLHQVIAHIFRGLARKKITAPAKDFQTHRQQTGIKCSIKASEGFLYCLERAFIFVPKPATYIAYDQVATITFSRVSGAVATLSTFDITVHMKAGGPSHQFSNINREDLKALEDFFRLKGLRVKNEIDEDAKLLAASLRATELDSSDDEAAAAADAKGGSKKRSRASEKVDRGSADEDSESPDEDFEMESESDVAEEFDSDHESSGDEDEDAGMDDKDDDGEAYTEEEEKPKKKRKN